MNSWLKYVMVHTSFSQQRYKALNIKIKGKIKTRYFIILEDNLTYNFLRLINRFFMGVSYKILIEFFLYIAGYAARNIPKKILYLYI